MLHTRALYNLIRFNAQDDPNGDYEPWSVEDLREVPSEELWSRLREVGISLDKETLTRYAEECDTPEELSDLLLEDVEDPKLQDQIYLLLFELWRRFFPEKQSISIFCDELDYRINLYDKGKVESDEAMQDALANLQEILDENADAGADPIDVFEGISGYCAHDLESFLCDAISALLDAGSSLYASELLDGFSPYMRESVWFEFLQARLVSFTDIGVANQLIEGILKREIDLELLLEILRFLARNGDRGLFVRVIKKINPLLKTQGEFQEVLSIVSEYYRCLDQDPLEQAIQRLTKKEVSSSDLLHPKDPDFLEFQRIAT